MPSNKWGRARKALAAAGRAAARTRSIAAARSSYRAPRMRGWRGSEFRHSYKRCVSMGTTPGVTEAISVNAASALGLANLAVYDMELFFTLNSVSLHLGGTLFATYAVPSSSEFTNLYDQYRIDYIDMDITFNSDISSTSNPTTSLPKIWFVEDHNDVNATTLSQVMQYDNVQVWQLGLDGGVMKRIRIKPTTNSLVYYNAITSAYKKNSNKEWLDTQYPNIPYYGVKMVVDPIVYTGATQLLGYISMNWTYHITCQATK